MVVACGAPKIGYSMNHSKMMRLFGQQREVFAQLDLRRGGPDWSKLAAVLQGGIGFHVPHVDMRGASAQEEQDR
jgi:hypothetical protein